MILSFLKDEFLLYATQCSSLRLFQLNKFILGVWPESYVVESNLAEKINPGLISHPDKGYFLATGYLGENMLLSNSSSYRRDMFPCSMPDATIFKLLNSSDEEGGENLKLKDSPGGVSACLWINKSGTGAWVWSTQPPISAVFYGSNRKGLYVVSNKPLCAYNSSNFSNGFPRNLQYVYDYIASAFSLRGDTLYPGIKALPPNSSLKLARGTLHIEHAVLDPPESIPQDTPLEEKGRILAELLRESVWPAQALSRGLLLLSGGKDSRTIAAALNGSKGISASFVGSRTTMESLVAQELAESIGLPLKIIEQPIIADPIKAALHSNKVTHGLGINFPHQYNFKYNFPFDPTIPAFHGHGHLLRGGFARTMNRNREDLIDQMYGSFIPLKWLEKESIELYKSFLDRWIDKRNGSFRDYRDILFYAHQDFRLGYFSTSSYLMLTANRFMVYPLLDERIARFASSLCVFDRVSERVLFQALLFLARNVTEVPLFGEIWRFDRSPEKTDFPDSNHNFQEGYEKRQPAVRSKLVTSNSKAFYYDEDYSIDKNKVIAENILNSSIRSEIRDSVKPAVWAEVDNLLHRGEYSKDWQSSSRDYQINFDAFIKRLFIATALADFNFL